MFPLLKPVRDSEGKNTGTKYQHLVSVWGMSKQKPKELEFDEPDESIVFVLDHFWDLKSASGEKITYNDLKAFQDCRSIDLSAWQCEAIMKIDNIYTGSIYG